MLSTADESRVWRSTMESLYGWIPGQGYHMADTNLWNLKQVAAQRAQELKDRGITVLRGPAEGALTPREVQLLRDVSMGFFSKALTRVGEEMQKKPDLVIRYRDCVARKSHRMHVKPPEIWSLRLRLLEAIDKGAALKGAADEAAALLAQLPTVYGGLSFPSCQAADESSAEHLNQEDDIAEIQGVASRLLNGQVEPTDPSGRAGFLSFEAASLAAARSLLGRAQPVPGLAAPHPLPSGGSAAPVGSAVPS
ncbi:unnamed protein product, partial [Polarella glacialis]